MLGEKFRCFERVKVENIGFYSSINPIIKGKIGNYDESHKRRLFHRVTKYDKIVMRR